MGGVFGRGESRERQGQIPTDRSRNVRNLWILAVLVLFFLWIIAMWFGFCVNCFMIWLPYLLVLLNFGFGFWFCSVGVFLFLFLFLFLFFVFFVFLWQCWVLGMWVLGEGCVWGFSNLDFCGICAFFCTQNFLVLTSFSLSEISLSWVFWSIV